MHKKRYQTLISLLIMSLFITAGVSAQINQPPSGENDDSAVIGFITTPFESIVAVGDSILSPECQLTSAEAGVYKIECDSDTGTPAVPGMDGELIPPTCTLENPEAGVFILNCSVTPLTPVIPVVPGGYTIQPGSLPGNGPSDIASQPDACDNAGGSYMSPGLQAIRNTSISFDDVVYNNQSESLVLYALYALEATELFELRRRFANPNDLTPVAPFSDGDIVTMGNESICISNDGFTLRLWQLDDGNWVVDTLKVHTPIDLSAAWPDDIPDSQNPGQTLAVPSHPVLVDGVLFRYLMPYIEPPLTTLPGATEVDSDLPSDVNACEYAAPSFLAPGMTIMLDNYGYERYPVAFGGNVWEWQTWTLSDWQSQLTLHGTSVNEDILQNTPLVNIPGNLESGVVPASELIEGINIGTVLDGPFCTSANAEPAITIDGITEAPDPAHDRFYTWWQVEINGEIGFYIENVGQYSHWTYQGIQPRKLFLYYMVPLNAAMETTPETCGPTLLFASMSVEPARGAMNLRAEPAGAIIGRAENGQDLTIFGEPICVDGALWWRTSLGGYIAETDPNNGIALLRVAVPDVVVTAEPVAPPTTNDNQPVSSPANNPNESTQPEQEPPAPPSATPEPPRPPRPTPTPTCDPAGRC